MEAVDQIKLLTRQSATKDTLEDVTRPKLRILRRKFSSSLWMLRSLWYAEPLRLVTIGRWMSRIDKETTTELDALDSQIQRKTLAAVNEVMTTPGTIPRQRQTETHGDLHTRHPQVNNMTSDIVKRTMIYTNRAPHKTAYENHPPRPNRGGCLPRNTCASQERTSAKAFTVESTPAPRTGNEQCPMATTHYHV